MDANLLDRRELAALVFKDDSLRSVGAEKFSAKMARLRSSDGAQRDVHTVEHVVETFCRVQNELEQMNPLGLIEQQYMPAMPPSRQAQRLSRGEKRLEQSAEDAERLKPESYMGKLRFGAEFGERPRLNSSPVIKPKTAALPRQQFRQRAATTPCYEQYDPPDYGEDPLHRNEQVQAMVGRNAMKIRQSTNVRKMKAQYKRSAVLQSNLPVQTPDLIFENAMPARSTSPSRLEQRPKSPQQPIQVRKQRSISPTARKTLEKQLYLKTRKVEDEMLSRVSFRQQQNTRRINETKNLLRRQKQQLTDQIHSCQLELQSLLAGNKPGGAAIYNRLNTQDAAKYIKIAPEFENELIQRYSEFSSLSSFWYTRGECGCLGCMQFLGLDRESVNYSVNQFIMDNREEEELEKIQQRISQQVRLAEAEFFKKGIEFRDRADDKPVRPERRPSSARTDESSVRYLVFPCGCSICQDCRKSLKERESKTCPACYDEFDELVRVRSKNARFGGQVIYLLGQVLLDLRCVCRTIGGLSAVGFGAAGRTPAGGE